MATYKVGDEILSLTIVQLKRDGAVCYNNKSGRIELIQEWELDLMKKMIKIQTGKIKRYHDDLVRRMQGE